MIQMQKVVKFNAVLCYHSPLLRFVAIRYFFSILVKGGPSVFAIFRRAQVGIYVGSENNTNNNTNEKLITNIKKFGTKITLT